MLSTDASITAALSYYRPAPFHEENVQAEVCIYGGNSAGIAAALQLARLGRSVIIVAPEWRIGGLSAGGLGETDIGNKAAIGGIAREFYQRVGQKYSVAEEWRFEPHIAEQVFHDMVREANAPLYLGHFLKSIEQQNARIVSLTTESGLTVRAKIFIDATYEGDLMARAGVSYFVGRESNALYDEKNNGVQVHSKHQFDLPVDPYQIAGDPNSGLLPGINPDPVAPTGSGDSLVQAYCFRLCLTDDPANRIEFDKPADYDAREYELLARYLEAGWPEAQVFQKFDPIHNSFRVPTETQNFQKVDKNNHGAVSTDFIGRNYAYPEADYATREQIFQQHVTYQKGLLWFMGHDERVPAKIRERWDRWGLARDEFLETGGWPHQLYVREARRLVSDYVMTEANCRGHKVADDAIGLAAYTMDSHNAQRFVKDGRVWNEGDVQERGFPPYPISYRSIVPRQSECENLAVPVCLAASHIAYGSIRMEPVFMITGQSSALAAHLAIENESALQEISYPALRELLQESNQVLAWEAEK